MTSPNPSMAEHPDLAQVKRAHDLTEIRERYDRAAESAVGQAVEGVTVLAGLFVALAAWIVGFTAWSGLLVTNLVVGLVVAALGVGFASAYATTHRVAWIAPLLGAWMIVAPWVVSGPSPTMAIVLSNVIGGAVVVLCGLAILRGGLPGEAGRR